MNEIAKQKIVKARAALIIDQPFFGMLALHLKLIEDETLNPPTLATDGSRVLYHPKHIEGLELDQVKAELAHEVMHCVLDHVGLGGRGMGRDAVKWNYAADYAVNILVKDAGFKIGPDWLYDDAFRGMTAERIYNIIPDPPKNGGGNANGQKPIDQLMPGDPQGQDIKSQEWKLATIQAAQAAKAQGKLPASMERFIDELVNPKVDWRAHLWRFATQIARDDYAWSRPNRRFLAQGLHLPGMYSENVGEFVIAVDTSGSVSREILTAFASEITAIRDMLKPERVHVIYCDAGINNVDVFDKYDEFEIKAVGGGGTDFHPPFQYVEKHGLTPAAFIYLTDLYGPAPKEPPPYPVLWACVTDLQGPWGETVKVEL